MLWFDYMYGLTCDLTCIWFDIHVWMWVLDHKESWTLKNWCFWIVVLSPLDWKIKQIHPKGSQSWIFIGRTDAEVEALILWPSDMKSWLMEKTLMQGKIEGRWRRGWQRFDGITDLMGMSLSKFWELVKDKKVWYAAVYGITRSETQLSNWIELNWTELNSFSLL